MRQPTCQIENKCCALCTMLIFLYYSLHTNEINLNFVKS